MDAWTAAMARGDFRAAWAICDAVLAARRGPPDDPRLPCHLRFVWDGRPFDGKRVLVRCYHGLGDTLQFIRFLPALRARAAHVTLEVQPELLPLLGGFPGVDQLAPFDPAHPLPPAECDIEVMELGHALRAEGSARGGYFSLESPLPLEEGAGGGVTGPAAPGPLPLTPSPKGRGDSGGLVALCARAGDWDRQRSVPLPMLLNAVGGSVARWVLHRDPDNPHDPLADIRTTAAILIRAALVITVDTMIAHLAGALGRPTWLLLKSAPDWRWRQPGRASRWYPSIRLYRQQTPGDWAAPLAEIAADLRRLRSPSPRAAAHGG